MNTITKKSIIAREIIWVVATLFLFLATFSIIGGWEMSIVKKLITSASISVAYSFVGFCIVGFFRNLDKSILFSLISGLFTNSAILIFFWRIEQLKTENEFFSLGTMFSLFILIAFSFSSWKMSTSRLDLERIANENVSRVFIITSLAASITLTLLGMLSIFLP